MPAEVADRVALGGVGGAADVEAELAVDQPAEMQRAGLATAAIAKGAHADRDVSESRLPCRARRERPMRALLPPGLYGADAVHLKHAAGIARGSLRSGCGRCAATLRWRAPSPCAARSARVHPVLSALRWPMMLVVIC